MYKRQVLEMTRFDLTSLVRGVIDSSKLLAQKNEAAIELDVYKRQARRMHLVTIHMMW